MTWLLLLRRIGAACWRFIWRDPLIAGVVLLAITNWLLLDALHRARAYGAAEHVVALNAAAALDTSVQVRGVDSAQLVAVTRQLAQLQVQRDSVDRLLHLTPVAKARVEIVMPPTTIHGTADSTTHRDSARVLTANLRTAPYTVHAEVLVPDDTARRPVISLGIAMDTAGIVATTGCVGDTARVVFTAPPWLPLRVSGGAQDPRVCQHVAPALDPPRRRWHLTIGPGYGIGPTGHHGAGLFAVFGWSPF